MAKVYSWKIDSNNYAYLYIDGKKHVSEKITNKDTLDYMIQEMKTWDAAKAEEEFTKMAAEVNTIYPNKRMEWSPDYWTTGGVQGQSVLLISGKGDDKQNDISATLEQFMADVNDRIMGVREELSEEYQDSVTRLNAAVNGAIGEVNAKVDSVLDELEATKGTLTEKIEDAKTALEDATDFLDNDITPDKIIDVIRKVDEIPDNITDISAKFDDINDKLDDYDDKMGDIDDAFQNFNDWKEPFEETDPRQWKDMLDDYDDVTRRLKDKGLIDTGADDDNLRAMNYFSNAIMNMSGDVTDIKSDANITNDKVNEINIWKNSCSGKVAEAVALVDNLDNTISGKVNTIVGASLSEINDKIESLSGRVHTMEMEPHGGSEGGNNSGNGNAGSEMTQTSNTIAQNGGNFTQTNESGFTITMADSGITLTNGTDSIILNSSGITLSGRIHMSGTLFKDNLLEASPLN